VCDFVRFCVEGEEFEVTPPDVTANRVCEKCVLATVYLHFALASLQHRFIPKLFAAALRSVPFLLLL
jgi:hypothetical protein